MHRPQFTLKPLPWLMAYQRDQQQLQRRTKRNALEAAGNRSVGVGARLIQGLSIELNLNAVPRL